MLLVVVARVAKALITYDLLSRTYPFNQWPNDYSADFDLRMAVCGPAFESPRTICSMTRANLSEDRAHNETLDETGRSFAFIMLLRPKAVRNLGITRESSDAFCL